MTRAAQGERGEGPAFCPHCGYDLRADTPMTYGDAHFDPRLGFSWRGEFIHLPASKRIIVATLMKANGRWVSTEVLAERCGYQGDDPGNLIRCHISKIREVLRQHGAPNLFNAKPGRGSLGYRWIAPTPTQLARAA